MDRILRILTVNSIKDLVKYKSFFLLIIFLIIADKAIRHYLPMDRSALQFFKIDKITQRSADYLFGEFAGQLFRLLADYRLILALAGLFIMKQLISLWPSSDMRRMHRKERKGFALVSSLLSLRWHQVLWDAVAVSIHVGLFCLWCALSYGAGYLLWTADGTPVALLVTFGLIGIYSPIALAGFSYSSKLAVIYRGSFTEKLGLFVKMFVDLRIMVPTWLFFLFRIVLETVFVAVIPAAAIAGIENYGLRILTAGLSAAPVYSYLKMASFKMFLEIYAPFPLVQEEYQKYYNKFYQLEKS